MSRAFVVGPREAIDRLGGIERHAGVTFALPVSYAKRPKAKYPLVLLPAASGIAGGAIEMIRLMAETREIREVVVAIAEADGHLPAIEADARARYRVAPGAALTFTHSQLPALVSALRASLATGQKYGDHVVPMRKPWVMAAMRALSPLLSRLTAVKPVPRAAAEPHRFHSDILERDFEIFVSLPPVASARPTPALVVLDANIEFATVACTAARLAAAGRIAPMAVIGVGVPRAEGHLAFGFRRLEEFSPPTDGYDYGDDLGRIFRSMFSMRGQDARARLGRAPALLRFLSLELLPRLCRDLGLDADELGLLGHSAGGTFTCYALTRPDSPFRRYAAISPGIGISGSWLMRQPPALSPRARAAYLCLGSDEKDNAFNQIAGIPDTGAYAERLRAQGGIDVSYECLDHETHSSVYARAVEHALLALYGGAPAQAAERKRA